MRNAQQLILAYADAPWRKQLQFIGLFSLALVMLALLASLYLIVSAQATTYGREIQNMQYTIKDLQRQNADLQAMLAHVSSADVMEQRAEELGLQPAQPEQIVYLAVEGYSGRQPPNLAPPAQPAPLPAPSYSPEFSQSLIDWFIEQAGVVDLNALLSEVTRR
jgi:cell division protein FtsL